MTMTPIEEAARRISQKQDSCLHVIDELAILKIIKRVLRRRLPENWPDSCGDDEGFHKATGYNHCRRDLGLED